MTKNKTFIELGVLALVTIASLVLMINTAHNLQAQLSFTDIIRSQGPLVTTAFNPCKEVRCTIGHAQLIGEDTFPTRVTEDPMNYGGNKICQCPDGKQVTIRPYTLRRYAT